MNQLDVYEIVKDIIYVLFAGAGVVVAWKGLFIWRDHAQGNTEYEIARKLYKSVLKLRDAIKLVRNPGIWPAETQEAHAKYPDAPEGTTHAVYYLRWEKVTEAYSELELEQLEAEVLWRNNIIKKLDSIKNCVKKLNIYLTDHLRPTDRKIKPQDETFKMIYDIGESDEFSKEVESSAKEVADFVKPKFKFSIKD